MDDIKYYPIGEKKNKKRRLTDMIKQKHLPFKMFSREVITPRSGLAIYSESLRATGIKALGDRRREREQITQARLKCVRSGSKRP
ncbi:MAG: hypothetical protein ACK415_11195 [Thermodesulfovibrionales bacterium]